MDITYSNKQLDAFLKSRKNFKNVTKKVISSNKTIAKLLEQLNSAEGTNITFLGEKVHEETEILVKNKYILNKVMMVYALHKSKLAIHSKLINDFLPKFSLTRDTEPKKCEVIFKKPIGHFLVGVKYDVYLATIDDVCMYFNQIPEGFKPASELIKHRDISFLSDEKFKEVVWKTFSGALIPAKSLSHQHLSNIIHYYRIIIGREHNFALRQLEERFGSVLMPYNPTIDFRSEIDELISRGYTDGKPKSPIIIDGKTVGHIRYD